MPSAVGAGSGGWSVSRMWQGVKGAAEAEKKRVSGFPLKTVTTTTTTQKRGKQTVTHRTLEVTLLETKSIPDSTFAIPAGYKETQMLPATPPGDKEKSVDR